MELGRGGAVIQGGADTGWYGHEKTVGNTKTKGFKVESFSTVYEMGAVATGLNACMLHYEKAQTVTGGYDKRGSNGWLSTIPILNVFGRLERRSREGKEKRRDTERREN